MPACYVRLPRPMLCSVCYVYLMCYDLKIDQVMLCPARACAMCIFDMLCPTDEFCDSWFFRGVHVCTSRGGYIRGSDMEIMYNRGSVFSSSFGVDVTVFVPGCVRGSGSRTVGLSGCRAVGLSVCLSVCRSVCPSVSLSVCYCRSVG
jgi:hypothetical protein